MFIAGAPLCEITRADFSPPRKDSRMSDEEKEREKERGKGIKNFLKG